MEQLLIDIENLKKWVGLGIIVTTNGSDAELMNKLDKMHETVVKNLNIPAVIKSVCPVNFLIVEGRCKYRLKDKMECRMCNY